MDRKREPETEGSSYMRLPWPLVAVGIVAFLAVLLGAGLYANRYLRPQIGIVPTTTAAAVAAAPTATASAPVATSAPTPLVLVPGLSPTATTPPATAAPSLATATSPSISPSALPTVDPALADEVGRAYVSFWNVRSQAVLELDPGHLSEVMDGDYLQNFEGRLTELRIQGHAIHTQVRLNYTVVQVSGGTAIIHDRVEDDSFYVDPITKTPLESPISGRASIEFHLRKSNGIWKVVDSIRAE